jgi:hypothetical protein
MTSRSQTTRGTGSGGTRETDLTLELLAQPIAKYALAAYSPVAPSHEETRRRRGYVVLAPGTLLDGVKSLRRQQQ